MLRVPLSLFFAEVESYKIVWMVIDCENQTAVPSFFILP